MWKRSSRAKAELTDDVSVPGYDDLEPIGRGGFSVVYRAHQRQLERTVAVKVLTIDGIDARARQQFRREVQLAGKLSDHPNVVTVLDCGETAGGRPYLAMDYYEPGSTYDLLRASGPLPVADVLRIGTKIAAALASAHRLGIVHGDVKPGNILISTYNEPALGDFGTAQMTVLAGIRNALTPLHCAPELLGGGPATPASDIYSLGSTLFHLLAGRPPYRADDGTAALLLRMRTGPEPRLARADVSPALVAVVRRAMACDPAERFTDAATFLSALQELQQQQGLVVTVPVAEPGLDGELIAAPVTPVRAATVHAESAQVPSAMPSSASASPAAGFDTVIVGPVRRKHLRQSVLVLGGVVAVAAALGVPVLLARPGEHDVLPRAASSDPPPTTAPAVAGSQGGAAPPPPSEVEVTDAGTAAALRWALPAGAEVYPVLVQVTPVAGAPTLVPLPSGTRTYTATQLDAAAGYCFQVGLLLKLGDAERPAVATWSVPVCIRGAFVGTSA